ncbi:hypothetical protein [Methylorubrum suomiense]|uniref:Uncharacterized protein n=1 Tax=Methylorubrum suomiense TaxID=144191 RepID=A0ABQ4V201_9HYPH|nr:hypothetical protein [Methylorubrum suomiense]GJE78104.1 hypothetical protein BGCPKDLD_4715 [Methylorubrum suomiense]
MGKQSRWQRGRMPDVPAHQREPDDDVLSCGHFGPRVDMPRQQGFEDLHPDLREILVRMDKKEAENLANGLQILVRLEPRDFVRMRTILRFINILYGIGWVLKWMVATFLTALGAVTLAGEQIQKIWGWLLSLLKLVRP